MHKFFNRLAPAMALCLPSLAFAQTGRSDPADAQAAAPPLRYSSTFADYKPWRDIKSADWRAVNDRVRDAAATAPAHAGQTGHAAAAAPAAASAPRPKAAAPAMTGPHGQHHHGGRP